MHPYLTSETLLLDEWLAALALGGGRSGAIASFLGVVRADAQDGRKVSSLEYEAHPTMAEACMDALVHRARTRWALDTLYVRHRIGRVGVGEAGLLVGAAAPHRREAFAACRFLVEGIKHEAPIWKRIHYDDGSWEWSGCQTSARQQHLQETPHALV